MDRSGEIAALGAAARQAFDEQHRAREEMLVASRRAIQAAAASIRATHRGEFDAARGLVADARAALAGAGGPEGPGPSAHADARSTGPLHDARKELAEAWLTLALVCDDPLPGPDDMGVDVAAYLNGLAEAASELRREVLDLLRHGSLERAEELMGAMDEIYSVLVTVDYPESVTAGLRRTTDALRAVLERTRGDLTTAMVASRLQAALRAARDRVDPPA